MTESFRTHEEAFHFLLEFTDYEKVTKYKYDLATFDLRRVEDLMAAVGSPHRAFRSVHVAGTKGKGSTAAMTQSILTAAGFRAGLYTSPHLCRVEERMMVDGRMMSEEEFVAVVNELVPYTRAARQEKPNESPTYFELVTAAGFRHFARAGAQFAAIEVGMGGRLDATNVITPEVSVITRVDFDHEDRLGHTLEKIAGEKAGIIKPNIPVICAPQEAESLARIEQIAAERHSPLALIGREVKLENVRTALNGNAPFCRFDLATPARRYSALEVRLLGTHQALNAAAAVAALETLAARCGVAINEEAIRRGLAATHIPARLEYFPGRPPLLLDGAHNPVSVRALLEALDTAFAGKRLVLLMGVSRDKNVEEILRLMLPRAGAVIFTKSDSPRAAEPEFLAQMARDLFATPSTACEDAFEALERARSLAGPDDLICATGSFFLAGMLRPRLMASAPE